MVDQEPKIATALEQIASNFQRLAGMAPEIARAAGMLVRAIEGGGKVLLCGNGGSAADCQHLAAELVGRYLKERRPLPALALTVDTSALTAIANDYAYAEVFARQIGGLGRPGDVLIALSTSGNSDNVLRAIATARTIGIATIGLTGGTGGRMREACDLCITVPSARTNNIQEMHIAIGHILCGIVEETLC